MQGISKVDGLVKEEKIGRRYYEIFKGFVLCFYFFLTFFEPYLNGVLGSVGKYYIFALIGILLLENPKIHLKGYHYCFILWLAYKMLSIFWSRDTQMVQVHFISQIGMIMLLIVLTSVKIDKITMDWTIFTMWGASFLMGFLAVFLSQPYHGIAVNRQVLVLFGQEIDPNNQAAFLVVGFTISLYYLLYNRSRLLKVASIFTLLVNSYSLLMTGSRGGLVAVAFVVFFFILFPKKKTSLKSKVFTVLFIGVAIVAVYFITRRLLPQGIYERLFDFKSYEDGSERTEIWKNVWELISQGLNILFGAGWGAYYGYNGFYKAVHNTYLSMLSDVGIIGCSLFFIPLVLACKDLLKKRELLIVSLFIAGMIPCVFLDAINKRYFWTPIFLLFITLNNVKRDNGNEKSLNNQ